MAKSERRDVRRRSFFRLNMRVYIKCILSPFIKGRVIVEEKGKIFLFTSQKSVLYDSM